MATITRMRGADAAENARGQINIPALPNFATTPAHLLLLRRSLLVASFDRIAIESDPVARSDLADISSEGGGVEWTPTGFKGEVWGQKLFAPHIELPYSTGFTIMVALTTPDFVSSASDQYIVASDDWRNVPTRKGMVFEVQSFSTFRRVQFQVADSVGSRTANQQMTNDPNTRLYVCRFDPTFDSGAGRTSVGSLHAESLNHAGPTGTHEDPNMSAGVVLRGRGDVVSHPTNELEIHCYAQWDSPLADSAAWAEANRIADWLAALGVEVQRS